MFRDPFSFEGRIRRTEYGFTLLIYAASWFVVAAVMSGNGSQIGLLLLIPTFWFLWAQGAKRCHDRGNSGWWQIIPFYYLVLLFGDGDLGPNQYGTNPKGINLYDPAHFYNPKEPFQQPENPNQEQV